MIKEHKINSVNVVPFTSQNVFDDPKKIKGGNLLQNPYSTVFLSASRKSGKSNVIGKILNECSDKKTIIWVFSPTAYVDDT